MHLFLLVYLIKNCRIEMNFITVLHKNYATNVLKQNGAFLIFVVLIECNFINIRQKVI